MRRACLVLFTVFSMFSSMTVSAQGNGNGNNGVTTQIDELRAQLEAIELTPGPTGPQGPSGDAGAQGPIGLTGPQGPAGEQGPIGLTGTQGPQGTQGLIGPSGDTGAQGPIGLTGPQGPAGEQGPIGLTGTQGPQGAQGLIGPSGDTGAQGPIGLTGPQGPAGKDADPEVAQTLNDLSDLVWSLQSRLELLENAGPDVAEFFVQDTPGDDLVGPELLQFFGSIDVTYEDYIYYESNAAESGSWCSENAAWYVDTYIMSLNTQGLTTTSGNWQKWFRNSGELWTPTTQSFTNYYGRQCLSTGDGFEWCAEAGIGGQTMIYLPFGNSGTNEEIYNGTTNGNGTLKIRVGSDLSQVCEFSSSPTFP